MLCSIPDRAQARLLAMSRFSRLVVCMAVLTTARARGEVQSYPLDTSIQPAGTISFQLHTQRAWANGAGQKKESQTFLRILDFGQLSLRQDETSVGFGWRWQNVEGAPSFQPLVPELPGPDTYFMQITWNADQGRCDFYVNGMAMRDPEARFDPWKFGEQPSQIEILDGPFTITELKAEPRFLTPEAARTRLPAELRDRHAGIFGQDVKPPPLDPRLGPVLYEAALSGADDIQDWVMEGPGEVTFKDGWLHMRSTRPDAGRGENGHIVFWCPRDFPESFMAEWQVQILSEFGLNIAFFAAKGVGGEDIFDPRLPGRDGTFVHYTRGAVKSYHISYFASTPGFRGRGTANLRKNNRFYLISNGPPAIPADSKNVHQIRLIKDGSHIQFQTDGNVVIDYTDPGGPRYGPVYGDGKIGLRQMQWTVARYQDFRVSELLPQTKAD